MGSIFRTIGGVAILICAEAWFCRAGAAEFNLDERVVARSARAIDKGLEALVVLRDGATPGFCSDEVFVRRAHLDIAGRLPDSGEVRNFLNDRSPQKHNALVDRLLLRESWKPLFADFASMLRLKESVARISQAPYIDWVKRAARENMPYDQFAQAMVTAEGDLRTNPATGYLIREQGRSLDAMEDLAAIFLGADLRCAACHDHPYNNTTQRDFYEWAAVLGSTQIVMPADESALPAIRDLDGGGLTLPRDYKYRNGSPGETVPPAFRPWSTAGSEKRSGFAEWMSSWGNQRFQATIALRLWGRYFGLRHDRAPGFDVSLGSGANASGGSAALSLESLVNKDKACAEGPAPDTNSPEEAQRLSEVDPWIGAFTRELCSALTLARYSLLDFQRILTHTDAYRREAMDLEQGTSWPPPSPMVRRMSAEQLWNALIGVCGRHPPELAPVDELSQDGNNVLRVMGRGARERRDDGRTMVNFALARLMMNGDLTLRATTEDSNLSRLLANTPPEAQIDEAFLGTLSRFPTAKERASATEVIRQRKDSGRADLIWALLNCSEFLFLK